MRVVATLSTMPHRYSKLLRTLKYLHQQTYPLDEIYVGIPKISKRLNIEYPPIPNSISDLCYIVNLSEDYGPITKLIGALKKEKDDETIIISFDDDVHYPPDLVENLVKKRTVFNDNENVFDGVAVGGSGFIIGSGFPFYSSHVNVQSDSFLDFNRIINFPVNEKGREVDILCGFAGIMYKRKFFKDDFITEIKETYMKDENLFLNDDVTISYYLSTKNIKKMIYPIPGPIPPTKEIRKENNEADISYDKIKFLKRFNKAIEKTFDHSRSVDNNVSGQRKSLKPLSMATNSYSDSVVYTIIILILYIIIFIFLVIKCYIEIII